MAEPERCLTCQWWGLRDSASIPEANRQCHRFPPIATRGAEGEIENHWPWTNQRDYCGEHRGLAPKDSVHLTIAQQSAMHAALRLSHKVID